MKLVAVAGLEKGRSMPRIFVGCRENTRFPRPIQYQRCDTAEIGFLGRSERETLPAVATTVFLGLR